MRSPLRVVALFLLIGLAACSKDKPEQPDPKVALAAFIPNGWHIEFDTLAPLLDAGREAHLVVLTNYDSLSHFGTGRMLMVIGPDKKGQLERLGANNVLLPAVDMSKADWQAPIGDLVKLRKNVVTVTTFASGAEAEATRRQESFKLRFDPATRRMRLIGYDLTDNTDGVMTLDSRNYISKKRAIEQLHGKDTLFHRVLRLRHGGAFLEDLQPWQFAVTPDQLEFVSGPLPESSAEIVPYTYVNPDDSTSLDDNQGAGL